MTSSTSLLSPATALRFVWAQTGSFSDDLHSRQTAIDAEISLKDIWHQIEKDSKEKVYIANAMGLMKASLRSLDVVYKSRQDNFRENEKLRSSYMQSITDSLEFGRKTEDFLKSLPTMTITAAGGVTIGQVLNLSTLSIWVLALGLGAAGYLINLWYVNRSRRRTQIQLIRHDYDRNLYYQQYIDRVADVLIALYSDLDRIHENVFGISYPIENKSIRSLVNEILCGVQPTFCKYVHEHVKEGKITPELWPICETGTPDVIMTCPYWVFEN